MNKIKHKHLFYILIITLLIFACAEEQIEEEQQTSQSELSERIEGLDLVINGIPSPIEIATIFAESGAIYNKSLLNHVSNINNYNTTMEKALNLGIYGADLNYVMIYNQSQEVSAYLVTVNVLADNLDISGVIDNTLTKRIEKNIGNIDSLIQLVFPIYKNIDKFLHANQQDNVAALILAGGWIEVGYLACQIIGDRPNNDETFLIYLKIAEQKRSLGYLIGLLRAHKDNPPEIKDFITKLQKIYDIYNGVGNVSQLTQEKLIRIAKEITELRESVI